MSASKNLEYEKTSFLNKSNSAFIERMYLKFVNKDEDLPDSWRDYFEGVGDELNIVAKEINGPSWGPKNDKIDIDELQKKIDQEDYNSNGDVSISNNINISSSRSNEDSIKAVSMIRSYRQRGHLIAKLDPLELIKSDYLDELHPESFGFTTHLLNLKQSHLPPLTFQFRAHGPKRLRPVIIWVDRLSLDVVI